MLTVDCQKGSFVAHDTQVPGKCDNAASPISTHGALAAVCIVIDHFEIKIFCILKKHKTVRPNAESSITQFSDSIMVIPIKKTMLIFNKEKAIPATREFENFNFLVISLKICPKFNILVTIINPFVKTC